jgi:murein DD-endopeptidase MepM/ murein hydrolase activator NlpD
VIRLAISQGNPRGRIKFRPTLSLLSLATAFTLLAGCTTTSTPTLVPPADTPVMAVTADTSLSSATRAPSSGVDSVANAPSPAASTATATTAVTPGVPSAALSTGLRPDQARLFREPHIGPEATLAWRPPPLPVPLSIHPDDHYWLIRPLPSDKRNYDLDWYPYGNDVLIADLAPYKIHHGLDFPNPQGTPVLAASSGTVVHAGVKRSRIDGVSYYGNTVIIKHDWQWQGKDVYTLYAHTLELFVEVGDYVEQGQLIAGVGDTGIVSGPHLHLEVRIGDNLYNDTRNPMLWIAPFEGWGTLAGRVVDSLGRFITGAIVSVKPLNVQAQAREQYTYLTRDLKPDEVWQENFVVGDLPAGRYQVTIKAVGRAYEQTVEVLPGRTNFVIVQTNFVFSPPTPTPTATLTTTVPITGTAPLSENADGQ